jgi:nucleotide-binding universal stress UspA family protein
MHTIRKILVPVDFSENSRVAAQYAVDLAKLTGGDLLLFHAYGLPVTAYPEGFSLPAELLTTLAMDAKQAVQKLAKELAWDGSREIQVASEMGAPAQAIVELARTRGFDLIVMGTHGRTGLRRLLIGSVAERVVRLAHCPVLTVPDAPSEK